MTAIDDSELTKLQELQGLLDEAYKHYFELSAGYCKFSEGHVALEFGNFWNRRGGADGALKILGVTVYSYVFGPGRTHHFESLDEALNAVRTWHAEEMSTEYDEDGDPV
ncbi:hypothetical protein [Arthrobacter sp. efr-133-TYG-118]|uniref:hypothetical protein n=1 Tax=Arthrobacter sp. efr-133-TYG-118 TaxID=3040279 RepID=UPI002551B0FD|nr:hypothetical protein [Arthrobacter sp. efr-133-TYG-118]